MKAIESIIKASAAHWVGDGFHVHSLFSYHHQAARMSPFLMLDYAAPKVFPADGRKRGVGVHPHRGFETVTIVYQGEVSHRDSTGQGGVIGPGDVQWMTAGAGILHEEFHSEAFSQRGGVMQMVQLWVNLPREHKMTRPAYQAISNARIPRISLDNDAGTLRPIAGDVDGQRGPATTRTPMQIWDLRLNPGTSCQLELSPGWTSALVVLEGAVSVNGSPPVNAASMALLEREKKALNLHTLAPSLLLLLSGEPIDEPIVGHGPFVMNSQAEIMQAFVDLEQGRFGRL